jgi:hypothetical protein
MQNDIPMPADATFTELLSSLGGAHGRSYVYPDPR